MFDGVTPDVPRRIESHNNEILDRMRTGSNAWALMCENDGFITRIKSVQDEYNTKAEGRGITEMTIECRTLDWGSSWEKSYRQSGKKRNDNGSWETWMRPRFGSTWNDYLKPDASEFTWKVYNADKKLGESGWPGIANTDRYHFLTRIDFRIEDDSDDSLGVYAMKYYTEPVNKPNYWQGWGYFGDVLE